MSSEFWCLTRIFTLIQPISIEALLLFSPSLQFWQIQSRSKSDPFPWHRKKNSGEASKFACHRTSLSPTTGFWSVSSWLREQPPITGTVPTDMVAKAGESWCFFVFRPRTVYGQYWYRPASVLRCTVLYVNSVKSLTPNRSKSNRAVCFEPRVQVHKHHRFSSTFQSFQSTTSVAWARCLLRLTLRSNATMLSILLLTTALSVSFSRAAPKAEFDNLFLEGGSSDLTTPPVQDPNLIASSDLFTLESPIDGGSQLPVENNGFTSEGKCVALQAMARHHRFKQEIWNKKLKS